MESYSDAYKARYKDTMMLIGLNDQHNIATFHIGGIAIECRLKDILLNYHKIQHWNELSRRAKDPLHKQEIKNPSHSLKSAMTQMRALYKKALTDPFFFIHLERIMHPLGSTEDDYIKIRYFAETSQSQNEWHESFKYICGWLAKNERAVL